MATGTIAASSARFGVSSVTTPSAAAIGAFANTLSWTFCHTALAAGSASCAAAGNATNVVASKMARQPGQGIIIAPPPAPRLKPAQGVSAQYTRVTSVFPLELRVGGRHVALVESVDELPVPAGNAHSRHRFAQRSLGLDRRADVGRQSAQVPCLWLERFRP